MTKKSLCLAKTTKGGLCKNYSDTCPFKSHKRQSKTKQTLDIRQNVIGNQHNYRQKNESLLSNRSHLFKQIIKEAEAVYGISEVMLKADYWLVKTLHSWFLEVGDDSIPHGYSYANQPDSTQSAGDIIFHGGTSLSAAWDITQRWSQDIDLLLSPGKDVTHKKMRYACKKGAEKTGRSIGCSFKTSSRSSGHYFFILRNSEKENMASVDIAFCSVKSPLWVQKVPVMSMIGRICDPDLLNAYPELGGFEFNTLGPGSTAMNKLLAQTETSASGDFSYITERARDVYDLACIARRADDFEGHIGRDSKALLHFAEAWSVTGQERPPDGFASIKSFDPSTREYEALEEGYENVMETLVWGEVMPLNEAIALAVSLDPGPAAPPPLLEPHPMVSYPRGSRVRSTST